MDAGSGKVIQRVTIGNGCDALNSIRNQDMLCKLW